MLFLLLVVGCFLRWLCRARIDEDTEQNPPDEGYEHTESYPQEDAAAEPNNSDEGYESNPSEDENADTAPKPPGHGNKNTEPDSSNNGNVNTESASHDNHHESLELSIYLDGFYHQPAKSFNHPVRRFLLFLHHCFLSLISFLLGETTIS